MIESTSSWTNASGSNPNVFTANGTISERKDAPGMSACLASHASRRPAMPCACGIPPRPAGCSITRLLSVIANWPSRKKPSRGVVAIQLGLPRPAFRNADCVVRSLLRQLDQFVLDLERAQRFESLWSSMTSMSYLLGRQFIG